MHLKNEVFLRKVKFKEFLAAALIASLPAWIFSAPIFSLNAVGISLIAFLGGCLGSYLIAKKTEVTDLHMKATLTLFSYIIFNIFITVLKFSRNDYEGLLPLLGFFLGTIVGVKFWANENLGVNKTLTI